MLVEAGLSPMEAIVATTGGAAEGIGFTDVGVLEPGRFADMLFVRGNPLDDIAILQDPSRIAAVIKGGTVVVERQTT